MEVTDLLLDCSTKPYKGQAGVNELRWTAPSKKSVSAADFLACACAVQHACPVKFECAILRMSQLTTCDGSIEGFLCVQVYITMAYNPTRFSQHPEMFFCATSQQVFASVCERVRVRGQATRFSQHPKMFFPCNQP